jgi:hypothetical protein
VRFGGIVLNYEADFLHWFFPSTAEA